MKITEFTLATKNNSYTYATIKIVKFWGLVTKVETICNTNTYELTVFDWFFVSTGESIRQEDIRAPIRAYQAQAALAEGKKNDLV